MAANGLVKQKEYQDFLDFPEDILTRPLELPHADFADVPILWEMYSNVHLNNSNQILIFNGLPRSGKSESGLDFAYVLDRDPMDGGYRFNLDKMSYTLRDYLKKVKDDNVIGSAEMWEEAGLNEYGANARDFMSKDNKDASTTFQSMGFKRHFNIVNLPLKIMLDKQIRSLVHWIITTERINSENYCIAKIYRTKLSTINDEVFNAKYRYIDAFGVPRKVTMIKIPRAPKILRKEYKIISDAFKREIQEHITSQEDEWRKLPFVDGRNINTKKLYEYLLETSDKYLDLKTKNVNINALMVQENIPPEFKKTVVPTITLFNSDLKNKYIKLTKIGLEKIAVFEQKQTEEKIKEKIKDEVTQKTIKNIKEKRKAGFYSDDDE